MSIKYLLFACLLTLSLAGMLFFCLSSYYTEMIKGHPEDNDAAAKQRISLDKDIPPLTDVRNKLKQCNRSKLLCQHSYSTCENLSSNCIYGAFYNVSCNDSCNNKFIKSVMCRYCYQTEIWEHNCTYKTNCLTSSSPRNFYKTNCTVDNDIVCLGQRNFHKRLRCNWTKGYRWSTALILSVTVGGFGVDRFYLGYWQEGIGKLFSFGGLGVWTLVDILLIAIRYLGPEDGSLYI